MTLSEFKAWFEGFTDGMDGPPGERQWAKIKERVSEITGNPVTHLYYHDHYWRPYWSGVMPFGYGSTSSNRIQGALSVATSAYSASNNLGGESPRQEWNSHAAMTALGQADAKAVAA